MACIKEHHISQIKEHHISQIQEPVLAEYLKIIFSILNFLISNSLVWQLEYTGTVHREENNLILMRLFVLGSVVHLSMSRSINLFFVISSSSHILISYSESSDIIQVFMSVWYFSKNFFIDLKQHGSLSYQSHRVTKRFGTCILLNTTLFWSFSPVHFSFVNFKIFCDVSLKKGVSSPLKIYLLPYSTTICCHKLHYVSHSLVTLLSTFCESPQICPKMMLWHFLKQPVQLLLHSKLIHVCC